ncbi:MAG: GspE/PulE family protein, partial [Patescibacteria group bacterium]
KAFILDSGLIKKDTILRAEAEAIKTKKSFRDVLLNRGDIKEAELRRLEAYILGIPFVDLSHETINPDILSIIPEPIARKHNIVSFNKRENNLEVAMLDPDDLPTIEFIKKKAGVRILPRLTTPESIEYALKQYQKSLEAEFGDIIKKETSAIKFESVDEEGGAGKEDLEKLAEDLPVIRIVDTLIHHAILQGASDIHVEPMEKEILVRYRIDGILHDAMTLPKQIGLGLVARIKVMANLKLDEHRLPQDGRFKVETAEYKISFRVSMLPVFDGEKIVMRLLPESTKGYTLEELGFWGVNLERIEHAIRKPTGIILATGPTGSGKTTTLYTILQILNTPGVNISTIEDPIEYRMPRINQTQVRSDIGLTFASGLRTLLRQDPNIIMVGEIRDNETASLAINAALTGHLVVSTLHTNSAAGAIPRLLDMKVEPFLIASTVNVIISQRLIRRICKEHDESKLSAAQATSIAKNTDINEITDMLRHEKVIDPKSSFKDVEFAEPKKSETCEDGYKGRIGIHEVLEMTPTIKELVVKNATTDQLEAQARKEGMITMMDEGFIRAAQKVTSIEEVFRVTSE